MLVMINNTRLELRLEKTLTLVGYLNFVCLSSAV